MCDNCVTYLLDYVGRLRLGLINVKYFLRQSHSSNTDSLLIRGNRSGSQIRSAFERENKEVKKKIKMA